MGSFTVFLGGAIIALIGYFAFIQVPNLSNSKVLQSVEVQSWMKSGRYFNYNGLAVFYRDSVGDALYLQDNDVSQVVQRPILLLLHGFPTFSYDFAGLYSELEKDSYHVIAVDLLGFGLSDKPHDLAYGFGMEADMIESLLIAVVKERLFFGDLAETTPISILAHDFGDSVVQELLARQLERQGQFKPVPYVGFEFRLPVVSPTPTVPFSIKSVVLLNGGLFPEAHQKTGGQALLFSKFTGPLIQMLSNYKTFTDGLAHVFGQHTKPSEQELLIFWNAICYKDGNLLLHNLQQYIAERRNNRDRIVNSLVEASKLIPIVFINGPADPVSGRHMANRYLEVIPKEFANVKWLGDEIGHYPQLEARDEVLTLTKEFLSNI